MKTFKLNEEAMIVDHLLLRVLNPRLLQKRTTRRKSIFIILIIPYNSLSYMITPAKENDKEGVEDGADEERETRNHLQEDGGHLSSL